MCISVIISDTEYFPVLENALFALLPVGLLVGGIQFFICLSRMHFSSVNCSQNRFIITCYYRQ